MKHLLLFICTICIAAPFCMAQEPSNIVVKANGEVLVNDQVFSAPLTIFNWLAHQGSATRTEVSSGFMTRHLYDSTGIAISDNSGELESLTIYFNQDPSLQQVHHNFSGTFTLMDSVLTRASTKKQLHTISTLQLECPQKNFCSTTLTNSELQIELVFTEDETLSVVGIRKL